MQINLHKGQSRVFSDQFLNKTVKHAVVTASRGWGKSAAACACVVMAANELMRLDPSVLNKNVAMVAPTFSSAIDIFFNLLVYVFGMEHYAKKKSSSLGRIWLPNKVEIRLVSAEAIERLRGSGIYYAVADEMDSWGIRKPLDAWDKVIHGAGRSRWSPKNAHRVGAKNSFRSLVVGTSAGMRSLYSLSERCHEDPEYRPYAFDYTQSVYLDPEEVERAKATMDPVQFRQEYCASFEESGTRVYHAFDFEANTLENNPDVLTIFEGLDEEQRGPVRVGIDFNVGINAACIGYVIGDTVIIVDELSGMANTEELAEALFNSYGSCDVYPDPTGAARKTSAPLGQTDLRILARAGHNVYARNASPGIVDSVHVVNSMCCDANGIRRLFISRKAAKLRRSMLLTQWVGGRPDTAMIDKSDGTDHWSDALRYKLEYLFGHRGKISVKRGFNF
jgi:hypothetical protein